MVSPRARHDPSLALAGLALMVWGFVIIQASRRVAEADEKHRVGRNRLLELEEQLETRRLQLDGALEKITELQNATPDAAGE
jgi:hypothetical protein